MCSKVIDCKTNFGINKTGYYIVQLINIKIFNGNKFISYLIKQHQSKTSTRRGT